MNMEEIFQELILSVGFSMAISYMIMKFQSHGNQENTQNLDGIGKEEALHEQKKRGKGKALVYDIYNQRKTSSPFAEFFEKLSVENIFENNVNFSSEFAPEVVEDAVALRELNEEKQRVGGCVVEVVVPEKVVGGEDEEPIDQSSKRLNLCEIELESEQPVQERLERLNLCKIERESFEDLGVSRINFEDGKEKERGVLKHDDGGKVVEQEEEQEGLFDDWEGIERTELEKLFGAAVAFVGSKSNATLIDRDLKIQLYGLHKIAIEGPCQATQPMALKVSARAKWNSWQRLGNMNRELAMEQYLTLLSQSIPGWMMIKETSASASKLLRLVALVVLQMKLEHTCDRSFGVTETYTWLLDCLYVQGLPPPR